MEVAVEVKKKVCAYTNKNDEMVEEHEGEMKVLESVGEKEMQM